MARTSSRHPVSASSAVSTNAEVRGISVSGNAVVRVRPDSVRVSVGVEVRAKTVEEVRSQAAQKMQSVLKSLRALEIPNLRMRTTFLSVAPVYSFPAGRPSEFEGYSASNTVSVAVRGVSTDIVAKYASTLQDAALRAGADVSTNLEFFLDNPMKRQEEALANAVNDARRKAEVMAKAAGVTITQVGTVTEGSGERFMPMQQSKRLGEMAPGTETPVEAGEIVVSSDVTVWFMIR